MNSILGLPKPPLLPPALKRRFPGLLPLTVLFGLLGGAAPVANAQTRTQTVALQPGWNVVWLEVQPEDPAPSAVFAGLPVASVWLRTERLEAAQFIQDQGEVPFNEPGWLVWLPPTHPGAEVLTTLFAVHGGRAYLIRLEGTSPVNWALTGRIQASPMVWVPDAFNLVGFPVEPEAPPTFGAFFAASAAHFETGANRRQPMYRLNAAGQWTLAADTDRLRPGEAYWIYTKGASTFGAPVEAQPEFGTGLDFGLGLQQQRLHLRNRTTGVRRVALRLVGAPTGVLAWRQWSATEGQVWPEVPSDFELSLPAGGEDTLTFAVRRGAMTGPWQAWFEVRDGVGTLWRVPVSAEQPGPNEAGRFGGLWVGNALVNGVAEVNRDPATVTPTQQPFPLRLLVHVDATGQARLLKEVIQLWEDGTYRTQADGTQVVDVPGRYVLVTDESLIGEFSGAGLRDGVPVGQRLSSASLEFDGGATRALPLDGRFAPGAKLRTSILQEGDAPTNPFKHKYHPDHDNLDPHFEPIAAEAALESFTVRRDLELEFATTAPGSRDDPALGQDRLEGVYRETLTGLHRHPIRVAGTFRLQRLTAITDLNPAPRR
jgi:hypothetical protein